MHATWANSWAHTILYSTTCTYQVMVFLPLSCVSDSASYSLVWAQKYSVYGTSWSEVDNISRRTRRDNRQRYTVYCHITVVCVSHHGNNGVLCTELQRISLPPPFKKHKYGVCVCVLWCWLFTCAMLLDCLKIHSQAHGAKVSIRAHTQTSKRTNKQCSCVTCRIQTLKCVCNWLLSSDKWHSYKLGPRRVDIGQNQDPGGVFSQWVTHSDTPTPHKHYPIHTHIHTYRLLFTGNETELSYFNYADYLKYKKNPHTKWWLVATLSDKLTLLWLPHPRHTLSVLCEMFSVLHKIHTLFSQYGLNSDIAICVHILY